MKRMLTYATAERTHAANKALPATSEYCRHVLKDRHEPWKQKPAYLPDWIVRSLCTMLKGSVARPARAQRIVREIEHSSGRGLEEQSSDRESHIKHVFLSPAVSTPQVAVHLAFPFS